MTKDWKKIISGCQIQTHKYYSAVAQIQAEIGNGSGNKWEAWSEKFTYWIILLNFILASFADNLKFQYLNLVVRFIINGEQIKKHFFYISSWKHFIKPIFNHQY